MTSDAAGVARVDLTFTAEEEAFRAEVRGWLAANVPSQPLPSMNTAGGFERHREWEHTLAGARLSAVSWPHECGGRSASRTQWLIFEEEYWAAGAPGRLNQKGILISAQDCRAVLASDRVGGLERSA